MRAGHGTLPGSSMRLVFLSLVLASCSKVEAPAPRPPWCKNAVAEIDRSRPLLPPHDVVPESIDALAKRMDEEALALGGMVTKENGEALEATADADTGVSAAAEAVIKRRHRDAEDTGAAERALAVVLRERERAVLVVSGQCGLVAPAVEQNEDWRKKSEAVIAGLRPQLRACAGDVPPDDEPKGMNIVVQIDPQGKATLATATDFTFDFGKWAGTNIAHCMIKRLEATKFPEPKGNATVLVPATF
jgi:hypothetical protein